MTSSIWDDVLLSADFVVIGGGIIGTSTAIELRERMPQASVMLVERDVVPAGASTRNAGFACVGSASEILHDVQTMGPTAAIDVIDRRRSGLALLRQRLGDAAMDYQDLGGHEIFTSLHEALASVEELNHLLRPLFNADVFVRADDAIQRFGFAEVTAMMYTPFEGTIDSGRMMQALWTLAANLGVHMRTGVEVQGISGNRVAVRTIFGDRQIEAQRQIVIATNAADVTVAAAGGSTVVPARGQIIVTEPIDGLTLRGSFHYDDGYYYFRNVGQRVLLGGARNIDMQAEQTHHMGITDVIQERLEHVLRTIILPKQAVTIQRRWSGIMGFAPNKQPCVERVNAHTVRAFACNGMGVALGSAIAAEAATLAAS